MAKYQDKTPQELGHPQAAHGPSVKEVAGLWLQAAGGEAEDEHSDLFQMIKSRPWLKAWYEAGAPLNSKYVGAIHDPYPATLEELTTAPSPFAFIDCDGMVDKLPALMEPHWKGLDGATIQGIIDKAKAEGKETREFDPAQALGFELGLQNGAAQFGASWLCYATTNVGARYQQSIDDELRRLLLMDMMLEKTKDDRERAARVYLSRAWEAGLVLFIEEHGTTRM